MYEINKSSAVTEIPIEGSRFIRILRSRVSKAEYKSRIIITEQCGGAADM